MNILLMTAALLAGTQEQNIEVDVVEMAPHAPRVVMLKIADTRDETAKQAGDLFDARDKDKSGYLEGAELSTLPHGIPGMLPPHLLAPIPPMAHHEEMDPAKMFDKIDTDGNGAISREEFAAHHKDHAMPAMPRMMIHKRSDHADKAENHGEVVKHKVERQGDKETREVVIERIGKAPKDGENVEVFVRRMGEEGTWTDESGKVMILDRMKALSDRNEDKDGDGRVSRQEAIDSALAHFDAMDANRDGRIGEDEGHVRIKRVVDRDD